MDKIHFSLCFIWYRIWILNIPNELSFTSSAAGLVGFLKNELYVAKHTCSVSGSDFSYNNII